MALAPPPPSTAKVRQFNFSIPNGTTPTNGGAHSTPAPPVADQEDDLDAALSALKRRSAVAAAAAANIKMHAAVGHGEQFSANYADRLQQLMASEAANSIHAVGSSDDTATGGGGGGGGGEASPLDAPPPPSGEYEYQPPQPAQEIEPWEETPAGIAAMEAAAKEAAAKEALESQPTADVNDEPKVDEAPKEKHGKRSKKKKAMADVAMADVNAEKDDKPKSKKDAPSGVKDKDNKPPQGAVVNNRRPKQSPPKRDDDHKGENVRMSVISEQRTDSPGAPHKTKARDEMLVLERNEYFAATIEAAVLEAAVRPQLFTGGDAMIHSSLEAASTLPLRFGSDTMCLTVCDEILVQFFETMGASSKASTVTTALNRSDVEAMPKSLEEALDASKNSTVTRINAADLYLASTLLCSPPGLAVPPRSSSVTPLMPVEQIEVDRLRALQKTMSGIGKGGAVAAGGKKKAASGAGNVAVASKNERRISAEEAAEKAAEEAARKKQQDALKGLISERQLDVLSGKFREPLLASVVPQYDAFVATLSETAESNTLAKVLLQTDPETCANLICVAKAEAEMCAHRLNNERERAKKKKATAEPETDDTAAAAALPPPAKKPATTAASSAKRGKVADPVYKPS